MQKHPHIENFWRPWGRLWGRAVGKTQHHRANGDRVFESAASNSFAVGIATLVLATSLWVVQNKSLLPCWLGWVGIILFIVASRRRVPPPRLPPQSRARTSSEERRGLIRAVTAGGR
jgi:hypothetical protein